MYICMYVEWIFMYVPASWHTQSVSKQYLGMYVSTNLCT